ncbi:Por secretion system C-terminal sorting domain-containing protein [Candidatus Termititenax aidoneus]|uniref:Por secretion system C-terminal sorting domain-containing protein n=1 Tax=Termititenax aidoneus TaxID=2218524 RepID=A0A388TB23_TERA1|nr:Por secretion system C-terminal sorting domain-containing protein [Candidatus Termititenax aidoneus]
MIYNNISYSGWRKNNPAGVSLPLTLPQESRRPASVLFPEINTTDSQDDLKIKYIPIIDVKTDTLMPDLLAKQAAVVLLNDMVLPFEAERDEFVLLDSELAARRKKVSAGLMNLAQYGSFSFDLTAAVNMTSDNWDELDTLYEYGGVPYTEHIKLGQRRVQKLFDFLWAAINDTETLNKELSILSAEQRAVAAANLQTVRENLLRFTDRAAEPKLLPEYQKLCYVYDTHKGVAPRLNPQDKTPVYTYEQSLNGRNPRVGITGLVLSIVNPGSEAVSQNWQDRGAETLVELEKAVARQVKAEEEAKIKAEAEAKAKAEAEAKAKAEAEAKAKAEAEAKAKAEAEAKAKAEAEAKAKAEAEAKAKAEAEAKAKAEAEAKAKAEAEAKAKAEAEAKAKAEAEAKAKAEAEAKAKAEEEARIKAEEEAKAKAEEEARIKAEEEAKAKAEEEARIKAEEEAKAKAEEEARIKAEEEARAKAEEEARIKAEEEAKRKKPELTFSGGGSIKADTQSAWLKTTILPLEFKPNIPWISSVKIGGGLDLSFHRTTERLTYNYLKPLPNAAPAANAGNDQTITLPTSNTTLDGSGSSDSDGSIASYEWTQTSGPVTATISSPTDSGTGVSGLTAAGTYIFQLKVTDNEGAESADTVTVTVNAALPPPNIPPVANAGNDQTITLPTSNTTLDGSGSSDSDGNIASYEWTQTAGPVTAVLSNPADSGTGVSGLTAAGTYIFQLKVTDNEGVDSVDTVTVTVNAAPPPPNVAPTANAGNDQNIKLPVSSVTLNGNASSDSDGSIASYEWTQTSGPVTATISSPTGSGTGVNGLTTAGTYTFQLKVTDNEGAESTDTVTVTVHAANISPTANAGTDQNIKLPANSVTLNGNVSSDSDGSIASYEWTQTAGPVTAAISSSGNSTTGVSGLTTAGAYTFQLKVTDNEGAEGVDTVTVNVYAANIPPTANAGNDQNIKLPVSSVTLNGGASDDDDGSITSYEWTQTSGPVTATISSPTSSGTGISGLTTAGTYTFQLKVTDNEGAESTDTVTVTVHAANISPTANAGNDQNIKLPANSVTLNGNASSDSDGSIASYEWTQTSGPVTATISSPTGSGTGVNGLTTAGAYTFQLKVTDNEGAESVDTVTVTVYAANIPPTADAGVDQTITLPTSNTTLDGSGSSDSDGSIASYEWTQTAGPATAAISSSGNSTTGVSGLTTAGTYTFQLKVVDNEGAETVDTVTIVVAPQPTMTVTKDITITFPYLLAPGGVDYALDLTPLITPDVAGWDADFPSGCVTYVVVGDTDASSYTIGSPAVITENFYYDGNVIATLTVTADVVSDGFSTPIFSNVSWSPLTSPIELSKVVLIPPPPLPSIAVLPPGERPANTPLNADMENPPFDAAGYPQTSPDFSSDPLRYVDDPSSPYALVEYFKNTMRFRILPHFDLEITGQRLETPLGYLTPFLQERFEIGVEFTAAAAEVAEAAPEAAVKEIEALVAQDNAVSLALANRLKIFSVLDLSAVPGQITAGVELQNSSYAEDRYSGSLKYLHDINYRALQSVSAEITGGFTQTGAGFWRGNILTNLLPAAETKTPRLTAGFNLFGENGAFGAGTAVIWRPLAFMEYGVYAGFQDVSRLSSVYGALAAKFYF